MIVSMSAYNALSRNGPASGSLIFPSFVPAINLLYPVGMTFVQRIKSLAIDVWEYAMIEHYGTPHIDKMVREHLALPDMPYLGDVEKSAKLFLINSDPLMEYKEPVFDNVKLVGGMQIKKAKHLPDLDPATDGVVLLSFGTNVRSDTLGRDRINLIISVFARLPKYNFLWKFESKDDLPRLPPNVVALPWMPQNDILAHPNTKLFITHCGLLSAQEAMW